MKFESIFLTMLFVACSSVCVLVMGAMLTASPSSAQLAKVRRAAPDGRGAPVPVGDPTRAWVPVLDLLAASDEELLERHGRWYVPDRDPAYLRRNALVVLANVGDGTSPAVRAALAAALAAPEPLVRSTAVWSARRLGCDDLLVAARRDPDPLVREELAGDVPVRGRS